MSEIEAPQLKYPYVEDEFGIDFDSLRNGNYIYKSGSGRDLHIEKQPGFLAITDGGFEMRAELDDGVLEARLFTKDMDPKKKKKERAKHIDMYASYFLEAFLQDCESQGLEVDTFRGKWMNGSDTYERYQEVFAKTGDKVQAAQANLFKPLVNRGIDFIRNPDTDIWENVYTNSPENNTVHAIFRKREEVEKGRLAA